MKNSVTISTYNTGIDLATLLRDALSDFRVARRNVEYHPRVEATHKLTVRPAITHMLTLSVDHECKDQAMFFGTEQECKDQIPSDRTADSRFTVSEIKRGKFS